MKFNLCTNGRESGPFSEHDLRAKLAAAEISVADLVRMDGTADWRSLESLLRDLPTQAGRHTGSRWRKVRMTAKLLICFVVGILLFSLSFPQYCLITRQANQAKAASNCKQIIGLLHAYSQDNCSIYPDSVANPVTGVLPQTSNDVFRTLFQEGLTQDETIFGCPLSKFNPDGKIGVRPDFDRALTPGENHWAMTQGQSNTSTSIMPIVFENPISPSWPPRWNVDAAGKPQQGRSWAGAKVIIGKNDGSVEAVKLQAGKGPSVGPRALGNGLDMFTQASGAVELKVLNIALPGSKTLNENP